MTGRLRLLTLTAAVCVAAAIAVFLLTRRGRRHPEGLSPSLQPETEAAADAQHPGRAAGVAAGPQAEKAPGPESGAPAAPAPATRAPRLVDRALSDFEDGTDQGWSGGTAVEGGQESKFALQCAEPGRPMKLPEQVRVGEETAVQFGLYTDREMKLIQFLGWCPAEGTNFNYLIRDYEPGRWTRVRIRLSELFTWKGLHEPVGNTLEMVGVWPKGPPDAVVRIDNVRVFAEPQPEPEATGPEAQRTF